MPVIIHYVPCQLIVIHRVLVIHRVYLKYTLSVLINSEHPVSYNAYHTADAAAHLKKAFSSHAEGLVFEPWQQQTYVVDTCRISSSANRSMSKCQSRLQLGQHAKEPLEHCSMDMSAEYRSKLVTLYSQYCKNQWIFF